MTKVQVVSDVALAEIAASNKVLSPTRVTLVTKDGRDFSEMIIAARGRPTEPLTWPELEDKCQEYISWLIPNDHVNRFLGLIHGIENLQTITDLTVLLRSIS